VQSARATGNGFAQRRRIALTDLPQLPHDERFNRTIQEKFIELHKNLLFTGINALYL